MIRYLSMPSLRRFGPLVFLALLIALLAPGCSRIRNPEGWADPSISADGAYVFQSKDRLSYITPPTDSAAVRWTFPDKNQKSTDLKLRAVYGEPLIEDGVVYFASYQGDVFALKASDGSQIWRRGIDGGVTGRLVSTKQALVFGSIEGRVWSIDKLNGANSVGWPKSGVKLPDPIWAGVAVQGDTAYAATMGGDVFALALSDGRPVWNKPFHVSGAVGDLALVAPNRLFVPSLNKSVYVVDTSTGQAIAPGAQATDWVWMQPAMKGSIAYYADFSGSVFSLDITSGVATSIGSVGAKVKSSPVLVGDVLVLAARDRNVTFFDIKEGKKLNTVLAGESGTFRAGLTASNDLVYGITTNGSLFRANPKELSVVEIPIVGGSK